MLESLVILTLILQLVILYRLYRRKPSPAGEPPPKLLSVEVDMSDLDRELEESERALEAFDAQLSPTALLQKPVQREALSKIRQDFYERWLNYLLQASYRGSVDWGLMDPKQKALRGFRETTWQWKDVFTGKGFRARLQAKKDWYEIFLLPHKACWLLHIHNITQGYVVLEGAFSEAEKELNGELVSLARARATQGVIPTKLKSAIDDLET